MSSDLIKRVDAVETVKNVCERYNIAFMPDETREGMFSADMPRALVEIPAQPPYEEAVVTTIRVISKELGIDSRDILESDMCMKEMSDAFSEKIRADQSHRYVKGRSDMKEEIRLMLKARIKELEANENYPHNFMGQMVEDMKWVLQRLGD